jgi:hypothetical protein
MNVFAVGDMLRGIYYGIPLENIYIIVAQIDNGAYGKEYDLYCLTTGDWAWDTENNLLSGHLYEVIA